MKQRAHNVDWTNYKVVYISYVRKKIIHIIVLCFFFFVKMLNNMRIGDELSFEEVMLEDRFWMLQMKILK